MNNNRPFSILNRGNFNDMIGFHDFKIISKFFLMQRGIHSVPNGKLRSLFKRLCIKYKTGNKIPKKTLGSYVEEGCNGPDCSPPYNPVCSCWCGVCWCA